MLRSVEIAEVSLALSRALEIRFGIAMAAMMAMIATTIISSMSVNPCCCRTSVLSLSGEGRVA